MQELLWSGTKLEKAGSKPCRCGSRDSQDKISQDLFTEPVESESEHAVGVSAKVQR